MGMLDEGSNRGANNASLYDEMAMRRFHAGQQSEITAKPLIIGMPEDPKDPGFSSSLDGIDNLASAGAATGNPYAIAAKMAISTIQQGKKEDYIDNVQRREAQLDHRNQMSSAMDGMIRTLTRGKIV